MLLKDNEKWLDSVYADSGINFVSNPSPERGEKIKISIRMLNNKSLKKVFLRLKEWGIEQLLEMKCTETEGNLCYYSVEYTCFEKRISYQFYLVTEDKIYYYTKYRLTDYIPDESRDFVILTDYEEPKWVKNSVFYQILPDRFANGKEEISVKNGEYTYLGKKTLRIKWGEKPPKYEVGGCLDFYGGDLYGIIEKLDYLQELGVTAIYLNPIFLSPTIHKYDSLDYFVIDPHLGGEEGLIKLSEEVHKRGMKIVLDISINHTSSEAKWFNKRREFYFIDSNGEYDTWADVSTMPKLNYGSENLRKIIYKDDYSVLKKWIKPPFSIDGWRFDVADCMARNEKGDFYHEVWREIRRELKSINPELLLLAEDWSDCSEMLQGEEWDSAMNYFGVGRPIREFTGETDLFLARNTDLNKVNHSLSANGLKERILQFYTRLPTVIEGQMFNLIDSHDIDRLHNNPNISVKRLIGAVMTAFGLPGVFSIYYGDEKYLEGECGINEGCRYSMDWERKEGRETEIFSLYKKLGNLKKDSELLHSGSFKVLYAEGEVFAFTRFDRKECMLFIWSKSEKEERLRLDMEEFGIEKSGLEMEVILGEEKGIEKNKNIVEVLLKPEDSMLVYFRKKQNGRYTENRKKEFYITTTNA